MAKPTADNSTPYGNSQMPQPTNTTIGQPGDTLVPGGTIPAATEPAPVHPTTAVPTTTPPNSPGGKR
jgi:hypothetical protein